MKKKVMNKKCITLIEVLISLALMTILLIPAANIVITAKKTNTLSEIKKQSTDIGQNVLENIRDLSEIEINSSGNGNLKVKYTNSNEILTCTEANIDSAVYTMNSVNRKGENYTLAINKLIKDGISHYSYNVPYSDYKKKYKVEIIPDRIEEYKNQDETKVYKKKQSYIPDIDTESDEISSKCKDEYDLIIKMTNDYNIILDEDNYIGNKAYDQTSSLVLVLKEQGTQVIGELHRNKGTQNNIDIDPIVIYSKKLCSMDELNSKYKDNIKILFYLGNNDSKAQENPYNLSQSLVVQSYIHLNDEVGDNSDAVQIDVLNGKKAEGYLDVIFDNSSYIHNINYFMPEGKTKRTGNLYSFTVKVTLNDEEQFCGKTTAIISKSNGDF